MATQTTVTLIDDLDGAKADETVTFGLDGKTYEIDLTTANADELRGALEPYLKSGRRAGGRSARGKGGRVASGGGSQDTAKIREWARGQGYDINDRGRVAASIREAYYMQVGR